MATEKTLALLEEIKTLTILEMADLVKALEEEFGVSAAAPVAAGAAAAAAPVEEKTEFDVILKSAGGGRIARLRWKAGQARQLCRSFQQDIRR